MYNQKLQNVKKESYGEFLSLVGSPNEAGCLLVRLNPAEYESVPSVD